jgi:phenylalanyl-tRNA synthetase beta chain
MKVSLSWLKHYVDIQMELDRLVDALTMAGLEVDSVSDRYGFLDTVVVGYVKEVSAHPDADRLKLCTVDLGDRTSRIICGAPNVRAGLRVPVALPGAELPGGHVIGKTIIRGVASEGMICSEVELALGMIRLASSSLNPI